MSEIYCCSCKRNLSEELYVIVAGEHAFRSVEKLTEDVLTEDLLCGDCYYGCVERAGLR